MPKPKKHKWTFAARFRRGTFGWRSKPAIQRVKEAVSEIKKVARRDPVLGGEGAVLFLEKLSPAIVHVDSSSGAIGTAVNRAIRDLVPIIGGAPVGEETRQAWLERLFEALQEDQIPYIELLGEYWGELCASPELASAWADELAGITRRALSRDERSRGFFKGTTACLSALFHAARYAEIVEITQDESFWAYKRWGVEAHAAMGRMDHALCMAEESRSGWASESHIDAVCEEILISGGRVDEAYEHYGITAERGSTYLARFRAVRKLYPHKDPAEILADLVAATPGEEGKWFAAAKETGLYAEAIELARRSPCDPRTLTRAARDFGTKEPGFALEAGMTALAWLAEGHGYEIEAADVLDAYTYTIEAADVIGVVAETRERIRRLVAIDRSGQGLVARVLRTRLKGP